MLREISLVGKVLEAILLKAGLIRRQGGDAFPATAAALSDELGIDIDTLLHETAPAAVLTGQYGMDDMQLEKFAELLYLLASGDSDMTHRRLLAEAAMQIYSSLEGSTSCCFYDRYYIMQQLKAYL